METLEFSDVTFSVDEQRRTIRGLVVPWNAISTPKDGKRYRFARESIKAVAAKFVKFFEDHTPAKHYGRAVDMQETDAGLEMVFKVNAGEHGDRMLALASSGAKTGLSVGVEFDESDTVPDPEFPGAFLVNLASLFEVSLVQRPSYNDARVITVMASATEGEIMDNEVTEATPEVAETETTPEVVKFAIPEGYQLVPAPVAGSTPQTIKPKASTVVTEPKNYAFDSGDNLVPAKHDFGIDIVQGFNPRFNDQAARDRVMEFVTAMFDVATSNIPGTNVVERVPRYVDQRDFRYPIWNSIFKGSLPSGPSSFDWVKYNSSSALVAKQTVEGTEPASGNYADTNQVVTPFTLVGKAKITRQAWDIGGIRGLGDRVWRQMMKGYYEILEAQAVAMLDAASPTSLGTFTVGNGTNQATTAAEMRKYIAALQYIRGGYTFDVAFAQVDLMNTLVAASDTTGRPLFPALGPSNADGTVRLNYAGVDVNGTAFLPAWALAATGTAPASSYLLDTQAVDAWADAPKRIVVDETEVANVYVGMWGYAATAINDINGIREIIYDPSTAA